MRKRKHDPHSTGETSIPTVPTRVNVKQQQRGCSGISAPRGSRPCPARLLEGATLGLRSGEKADVNRPKRMGQLGGARDNMWEPRKQGADRLRAWGGGVTAAERSRAHLQELWVQ